MILNSMMWCNVMWRCFLRPCGVLRTLIYFPNRFWNLFDHYCVYFPVLWSVVKRHRTCTYSVLKKTCMLTLQNGKETNTNKQKTKRNIHFLNCPIISLLCHFHALWILWRFKCRSFTHLHSGWTVLVVVRA